MASPADFVACWISGTGAQSKVFAIDGHGHPWSFEAGDAGGPPTFATAVFIRDERLHALDDDGLFWIFNPSTKQWQSGATLEQIDPADPGPWKQHRHIRGSEP